MIFMWDSHLVHLSDDESWHLRFEDTENQGMFELRLSLIASKEDYTIVQEDGRGFKQFVHGEYPYFLFDYVTEVVNEINKEMKAGNAVIDIGDIVRQVRSKWVAGRIDHD